MKSPDQIRHSELSSKFVKFLVSGVVLMGIICFFKFVKNGNIESEKMSEGELILFLIPCFLMTISAFYARAANGLAVKIAEDAKRYYSNGELISKSLVVTPSPAVVSELKIKVVDGVYRVFENYTLNGVQYTFGFPKINCPDQRVWLGRDTTEVGRITLEEARRRIGSLSSNSKYLS